MPRKGFLIRGQLRPQMGSSEIRKNLSSVVGTVPVNKPHSNRIPASISMKKNPGR